MDKFVVVSQVNEKIKNDEVEEDTAIGEELEKKDIRILRDYIEKKMNMSQKMQIIDIVVKNDERYTKNKNGYFINLNNLSMDVLNKVKKLVDYMRDNMKELRKVEDKMNEEKSKIEDIDKDEDTTGDNIMEKNINFEIYSLDGVQSEIFEEFREDNSDELKFMDRELMSEKRENSGYKIILKRYKRKYGGNKAKILKKFRDIAKSSVNNKSAKNVLNKPVSKKVNVKNVVKNEETENIGIEETYVTEDEVTEVDGEY